MGGPRSSVTGGFGKQEKEVTTQSQAEEDHVRTQREGGEKVASHNRPANTLISGARPPELGGNKRLRYVPAVVLCLGSPSTLAVPYYECKGPGSGDVQKLIQAHVAGEPLGQDLNQDCLSPRPGPLDLSSLDLWGL